MKEIKEFNINTKIMSAAATKRDYTVIGDPGSMFSLIIKNKSGNYYNFPEDTDPNAASIPAPAFAAGLVELKPKTIDSSGVFNSFITFPAITGNAGYTIFFFPKGDTKLSDTLSKEDVYISPTFIRQFDNTTVTFSLLHSSSAVVEPSSVTSTGLNHVFNRDGSTSFSLDWDITLGSSQCIIIRQPVATDFEFTKTKTTKTTKSSDLTKLEITDIEGLSVGMGVSGTGIDAGTTVSKINRGYYNFNKSTSIKPYYDIPTILDINTDGETVSTLDKGGTITLNQVAGSHLAGRNLTFTGKGSAHSKTFNNTIFNISNFVLTIDPVVTTTDAAVSDSQTIPITSTDGIKAADTILMSGIGVTTAAPHVDTVNDGVSVVVSAAQTIENGQTVTFTGSSRAVNIKADVVVLDHGDLDMTLRLNLDNLLTVG